MIRIDKNTNNEEINLLYSWFLRCQSGDKSVLNHLFKKQDLKIEQTGDMKSFDSTLNPDLEQLIWEYERDDKETDLKNDNVVFSLEILNKMLSKMKRTYSNDFLQTSNKYYCGKYNISEFSEILQEVVIELFQTELDDNGCATYNGKRNNIPIIDGGSLLKNISYFFVAKINKEQSKRYMDIFEEDDLAQGSLFDLTIMKEWEYKENERWSDYREEMRLIVYTDILEWIREHRNSIYSLFKRDSYEIQAIIDTILASEEVFISEGDGRLQLVTQKELQTLIYEHTGKIITPTNISVNMKIIEQRLIDHLLYTLNYRIGCADKKQTANKVKRLYTSCELQELENKQYFKLFGRENMFIYKLCYLYNMSIVKNQEFFLKQIKEHSDAIIPVLSLVKGRKKYDMINLICGNLDVIDSDISHNQLIGDIAHTLLDQYKMSETVKIAELKRQYEVIDRFTCGKSQIWEAEINEKNLKIRFWRNENVKHPVDCEIARNNLLVYEGYENFYLCNEAEILCYIMPKCKRAITKSDSSHNIFFDKIA